jgi:class 3 adenylate cyclase
MTAIFHPGPNSRRLLAYLRRRARAAGPRRAALDLRHWPALTRREAVVFTDTADFTVRTLRDGILHFLMAFEKVTALAAPAVRAASGRVVKIEGDSLLLTFPNPIAACAGVDALEASVGRYNRGVPENERFRFSYGIGYGDLLQVDGDRFGLELNLASKLGEDLARPGEALLTPAAAAALDAKTLRRVVPYRVVTFKKMAIPVQRLRLTRRAT